MIPPKHQKRCHIRALTASQSTQPGFATSDGPRSELDTRPNAADEEGGHCYALQTATERLVVDPSQKGGPGDLVVVWRKKRGPVVTRRLARRAPFNTYHFCDLTTGAVIELPCNKVSAIHAVVRGMPA